MCFVKYLLLILLQSKQASCATTASEERHILVQAHLFLVDSDNRTKIICCLWSRLCENVSFLRGKNWSAKTFLSCDGATVFYCKGKTGRWKCYMTGGGFSTGWCLSLLECKVTKVLRQLEDDRSAVDALEWPARSPVLSSLDF